jgi:opine dehydrogenase
MFTLEENVMTSVEKVTILSVGNGGQALGFHLSSLGHQVMLYTHPNFTRAVPGIKSKGGVEAVPSFEEEGMKAKGCMKGFQKVAGVTTHIEEAMAFSDYIFVLLPSFGQDAVFDLLIPHLRDEHIITSMPGNFGSIVLQQKVQQANLKTKAVFAETNSIIHACRRVGPGQVIITGAKETMPIGVLPSSETARTIERLQPILPAKLEAFPTVLEIALTNINMIAHPTTTLLNMGWCETRQGQFLFYKEGISKSVAKVLAKVDEERCETIRRLGLKNNPTFLDVVKMFYNAEYKDIYEFASQSKVHEGYTSPKDPHSRYITEDIPYLLVPLFELGQSVGVTCDAIRSVIELASIMNEEDYFKTGRTLKQMGLANLSPEAIIERLIQ